MPKGNYNKSDVISSLEKAGISAGDTVYGHIGLLKLGIPDEAHSGIHPFNVTYEAMREVLSPSGTFFTPTYSYSFCEGEVFDPLKTPSAVGPFGNKFLKQKGVIRSLDPIFSVAGVGPKAGTLFKDLPNDSFGPGCFYDRLEQSDAKICHIGVDLFFSTCIHYLEQVMKSPHRFMKMFSGHILENGTLRKMNWLYNVRILGDFSLPRFDRLHDEVIKNGTCTKVALGVGFIYAISVKDLYATAREMLSKNLQCFAEDPYYNPRLNRSELYPLLASEDSLQPGASIEEILKRTVNLPRELVSDGFDIALDLISAQLPLEVHDYCSGEECLTWIVPEKWTCHSGSVQDMDGKNILSYEDHVLHVMSYSLPVDKTVAREELYEHLYVDDEIKDAIPYRARYYDRDWGFCCSKNTKAALVDDFYHVKIDSSLSFGAMKVGEVVVKGESDECYVLCTHLCHPGQLNDGLSGVCAGVEVLRNLKARTGLNYTYRLLILPEAVGAAAWLSCNKSTVDTVKGGICLDLLARDNPLALQLSLQGDSQLDKISQNVLKFLDSDSWSDRFMAITSDDSSMFNAPGMDIPMVSLSRSLPKSESDFPFYGHHTDLDNYENANVDSIIRSAEAVLSVVDALEVNGTPQRQFDGVLFPERYSRIDPGTTSKALHLVTSVIDGKRTIADIASDLDQDFFQVKDIIDALVAEKLVAMK